MAGERKPLQALTSDDKGAVVTVLSFSLVSLLVCISTVRFWHAIARKLPFGYDDACYLSASALAITTSALSCFATSFGLGKHIDKVNAHDVDSFFKVLYSTWLLGIASMALSKTSTGLLINRIFPKSRFATFAMYSIIASWAIYSLFAISFLCGLPNPWVWTLQHCPSHGRPLYPVLLFNALSDLVLGIWIIPGVISLAMPRRQRATVIVLFGLRVCVSIPAISEMFFLSSFLHSSDPTRSSLIPVILEQITIYASVISATIPRTNQLLSTLGHESVHMRVPDVQMYGTQSPSQCPSEKESSSDAEPPKSIPESDTVPETTEYSSTSILRKGLACFNKV